MRLAGRRAACSIGLRLVNHDAPGGERLDLGLAAVDAELRNDAATAARHGALERDVSRAKPLPRIAAEIDTTGNARPRASAP